MYATSRLFVTAKWDATDVIDVHGSFPTLLIVQQQTDGGVLSTPILLAFTGLAITVGFEVHSGHR